MTNATAFRSFAAHTFDVQVQDAQRVPTDFENNEQVWQALQLAQARQWAQTTWKFYFEGDLLIVSPSDLSSSDIIIAKN